MPWAKYPFPVAGRGFVPRATSESGQTPRRGPRSFFIGGPPMATFVLVHGSWHGAWCWYKVTAALEAAGHRVIVPDLPAHGRDWRVARGRITLAAMTRSIVRILD